MLAFCTLAVIILLPFVIGSSNIHAANDGNVVKSPNDEETKFKDLRIVHNIGAAHDCSTDNESVHPIDDEIANLIVEIKTSIESMKECEGGNFHQNVDDEKKN